jgi:flagellar protein FliO/FliZ
MVIVPLNNSVSYAAQSSPTVDQLFDHQKSSKSDDNSKKRSQQDNSSIAKSSNLTFFDYIKMIFSFIFVMGLLFLVLYWIKRNGTSFSKNELVKSIGGKSVGSNKSVQLLKIGNSIYVVGVGENVTLLKEIDEEEEKELITKQFEDKLNNDLKVPKWLEKFTNRDGGVDKKQTQSFQSLFKDQLSSLKDRKKSLLNNLGEKGTDKHE